MGQAVARKSEIDTVASPDGTGICCVDASIQATEVGSTNVFVNGIGVVRLGDVMKTHQYPGPCCNDHAPPLTTSSSTVFVNGKGIGRKGDAYGGDHIISSGSPNVYAG
jgi:uncharacterized Zn-binding protein involved in type VI secretion